MDIPIIETKRNNDPEDDLIWNTIVNIQLIPNPKLSDAMQQQIMKERGMINGVLEMPCRGALVPFQLWHMQIPDYTDAEVEYNPVVLGNRDDIKCYFFRQK